MGTYGEFYDGWVRTGPKWGPANVLLDQQTYSTKKFSANVGKMKLLIKEENNL